MAAPGALDAAVKLGGKDVPPDQLFDLVVDAELDHPDMCSLTLGNQQTRWSADVKEGDEVVVEAGFTSGGGEQGTVFKGEVTGIEPIYQAGGASRVILRALNALHKLARGKKSVAWTKVTDKDIVDKISQSYSLSADFGKGGTWQKFDHVYQHNQSDLEFLRLRAARNGVHVWVQDKKLFFCKRTDKESGLKYSLGESGEHTLERFLPRMSLANQVAEVRVRGWDPEQKKEIVGSAKPDDLSHLGSKTGWDAAKGINKNAVQFVDVDVPVYTVEEAKAIAKSILEDRLMSFITGDATTKGSAELKPGIIIEVNVGDGRFDGKYFVTAVRHRYVHEGPDKGFRTHFKFKRDAESK